MARAFHQSEYGSYRHLPQCMIEQVPNFLSQLWRSWLRSQVASNRSHRPSLCASTCMRFISMVLMQARHFFATMHSRSLVCLSQIIGFWSGSTEIWDHLMFESKNNSKIQKLIPVWSFLLSDPNASQVFPKALRFKQMQMMQSASGTPIGRKTFSTAKAQSNRMQITRSPKHSEKGQMTERHYYRARS